MDFISLEQRNNIILTILNLNNTILSKEFWTTDLCKIWVRITKFKQFKTIYFRTRFWQLEWKQRILNNLILNNVATISTGFRFSSYSLTWDRVDLSHSYRWMYRTDMNRRDRGLWADIGRWIGMNMEIVVWAARRCLWTEWRRERSP